MVFLDKAFAVNPRNPYTLAVKGLALDRLGKTNEDIEFYDKALTIDQGITLH